MPRFSILLLTALLLPAAAAASEVRVRSEHPKASVSGSPHDFLLLRSGESLRGAVLGPKEVRVVLRRLGTGNGTLRVKLKRDGRDEGTLKVGGRPIATVDGHAGRAGAEVDRTISVPPGPHTIAVELLQGDGELLVAFTPPEPPRRVARARKVEDDPAPVPLVPPAEPKSAPVAASEKPRAAERPTVAATTQVDDEELAPAPLVPPHAQSQSSSAAASAPTLLEEEEDEPEKPPPSPLAPATSQSGPPAAIASRTSPATTEPSRFPLWVGARGGLAGQTQFGTPGTALGLQFRSGLFAGAGEHATRGALAGLAVDWVRYAMAFELGAARGLPALRQELSIQAFPIVAELGYAFGSSDGRLTPVAGVLGGVTFSRIGAGSALSDGQQLWLSPALGLYAGIEYGVGRNRFGFDVRYLSSRTGDSSVARNFEVGGFFAQASWRYGL